MSVSLVLPLLYTRLRPGATGVSFVALIGIAGLRCSGPADPTVPVETSATISGLVTGAGEQPLAGAQVSLNPGGKTIVTDASGRYRFEVESSGQAFPVFSVRIEQEGYETVVVAVVVGSSGVAVADVTLLPVEPPPAAGPEPFEGILVDGFSEDEVRCIAPGTFLDYTVTIANEGVALSPAIILHDTLDATFGRALTSDDIAVDREMFPEAVVTLDPEGRSFRVELGSLPVMSATEVYTVRLPVGPAVGVHCNSVSAVDPEGRVLSDATSCVTNLLVVEIDLVNEDGAIIGGAYTSEPEVFHVGDGGADRLDALVYRVVVVNHHCGSLGFPSRGSSLTSIVGARSGAVEFRQVLTGFPSHGAIVSTTTGGFVWEIGTLAPGEEAEVRFRAEAIAAGEDVHRVELSVPQLPGVKVHEEPITILP
jgi:hypothetical protein